MGFYVTAQRNIVFEVAGKGCGFQQFLHKPPPKKTVFHSDTTEYNLVELTVLRDLIRNSVHLNKMCSIDMMAC